MWLNKDTPHVPLPKEGHLGILPQGGTDITTCRRISQLEVHQLLISGLQVAYPVGLNGWGDPIITSLPKSLANGIGLTGGRSIYLEVNILQPMAEELDWKASPIDRCSSILIASPLKATPPKLEREVSMTIKVRSLLSQVMLDTSGCMSGNSTPKRPNPVVILTPPPHKLRDLSRPVDTSSKVSTPNDIEMVEASLEEVPTTISPIAVTPGSRSITPPTDVSQLWEQANKALEELLATKLSINTQRQKVVWEVGMELHQNDSKTAESIKEARAICTHVTLEAEALCSATVKEANATCTHTIWEAKAICSTAIRDAETQGASQADSLHRQHVKTIKHLEEQVIQEEGKSQIDFLSACQAALQASPAELRGALVAPYHILIGQAPTSHPFTLSQGASPLSNCLPQQLLLQCLGIPPGPRGNTTPQTQWTTCLMVGPHPRQPWKGPQLQVMRDSPWYKVLKWRHSEAFSQDTSLVREPRKEYFKMHSPNFTMEGMHDLSEVFRHMAKSAGLPGSAMYKIQEVWEGPDEL